MECRPTDCPHCQSVLAQDLPDAAPLLVTPFWELPLLRPTITDYQQHTVCCPVCAVCVTAPAPPEAATGYGARVVALCGHLHGKDHLSYRAIADLLADVADLPIGLASVVASTQRLSAALAPIDIALHSALQSEKVVNVDETSWRERGARRWLWAATSATLSVFRISASRGRSGLDLLLDVTMAALSAQTAGTHTTATVMTIANCAGRTSFATCAPWPRISCGKADGPSSCLNSLARCFVPGTASVMASATVLACTTRCCKFSGRYIQRCKKAKQCAGIRLLRSALILCRTGKRCGRFHAWKVLNRRTMLPSVCCVQP